MNIDDANLGGSSLVDGPMAEGAHTLCKVPLITGRQLIAATGIDRVDLVKIDVEGHEEAVFRGIADTLREYRPRAIVFEHLGDLATSRADASIRHVLDPLGYVVYGVAKSLFSWSLVPVNDVLSCKRVVNYIALGPALHAAGRPSLPERLARRLSRC